MKIHFDQIKSNYGLITQELDSEQRECLRSRTQYVADHGKYSLKI